MEKNYRDEMEEALTTVAINFPSRIQISLGIADDTDELTLNIRKIKPNRVRVKNIKFYGIDNNNKGFSTSTTLLIDDFKSFNDLYFAVEDLRKKWLIKKTVNPMEI